MLLRRFLRDRASFAFRKAITWCDAIEDLAALWCCKPAPRKGMQQRCNGKVAQLVR